MPADTHSSRPAALSDEALLRAASTVLEIEAEGLGRLSAALGPSFPAAVRVILGLKGRAILAGVGKSGHVARKIAATLASTGTPAQFVHPTEASHGDLGMITAEDVILALSNSGETKEFADLLSYAKRFSIKLIAMTAGADSQMARVADIVLLLPKAEEACQVTRAPTTSTTMQMALGDALAVALLEARGFTAADFGQFHPGGKLGAALKTVADLMHTGAEIPLVRAEAPMAEALIEMSAKGFGCACVVDGAGRLEGVITDGDLRRHMSADLPQRTAAEVMTRSPRTIAPDALAGEALALMTAKGAKITVLIVEEGGKPVGVLHLHDCLRAGVA